ncbi:hypothetical protein Tco_0162589 [Tanacetum coccineum]
MDREVKRLKQSCIPIVKVCWNSWRGLEFTWEREDQMQKKYPHLFAISTPVADATLLLHLRRCMGASVDHLSDGLKLGERSAHWPRDHPREGHAKSVDMERGDTFWQTGKTEPTLDWTFKIIDKVGTIVYRLKLPEQLSGVHSMFHVLNLKKCMTGEPFTIPLDEIQIEDKLYFIEKPVKIMDREVKRLNQSRIPFAKVCSNFKRGPEFTWERE